MILRNNGKTESRNNQNIFSQASTQFLIRKELGHEYIKIKSHTLNAIHLVVFAHKGVVSYITGLLSSIY